MEKYCTNCGEPVGENEVCTNCDTEIFNLNELSCPTNEQPAKPHKAKKLPYPLSAIIIILGGALLWVAAIAATDAVFTKIDSAIQAKGRENIDSNFTDGIGGPDENLTNAVTENMLTVDICIPAMCFNETNPATAELTQEQKNMGFKSAKVNEDGSVTYTVSKKAFETIKQEMSVSTKEQLAAIPNDAPSVKAVEYTDDFSSVTLKVNKEAYEQSLDSLSIFQAGFLCNMYQAYTGVPADKMKTVVKVVDESTGYTLATAEYPKDLNF